MGIKVHLKPATLSDAEALHRMQATAFRPLLEKYNDFAISPAAQTLGDLREQLVRPDSTYYFIMDRGTAVGAIRVVDHRDPEQLKVIAPLFILAQYRNRGYAQAAVRAVEAIHGEHGWALDTVREEPGNRHLYEKLRYRRTGTAARVRPNMTLIDYEKD